MQAQETRRIVDRLFGYSVSPLLWKKMIPKLSAGRVQSVAVRLMVERERTRQRFTKASYSGLKARFAKDGISFDAELLELAGERVATGKDFDPDTGALKASAGGSARRLLHLGHKRAQEVADAVRDSAPAVESVEEKPFKASPQPPYVTSTLQQEANSKLRFQARHTMRLAQQAVRERIHHVHAHRFDRALGRSQEGRPQPDCRAIRPGLPIGQRALLPQYGQECPRGARSYSTGWRPVPGNRRGA